LTGGGGSIELLHSASTHGERVLVGTVGVAAVVRSYSDHGRLVGQRAISGSQQVTVQPGGFTIVMS
jgi:hypothetical protein